MHVRFSKLLAVHSGFLIILLSNINSTDPSATLGQVWFLRMTEHAAFFQYITITETCVVNCVVLHHGENLQGSRTIIVTQFLTAVVWLYSRPEHMTDRDIHTG